MMKIFIRENFRIYGSIMESASKALTDKKCYSQVIVEGFPNQRMKVVASRTKEKKDGKVCNQSRNKSMKDSVYLMCGSRSTINDRLRQSMAPQCIPNQSFTCIYTCIFIHICKTRQSRTQTVSPKQQKPKRKLNNGRGSILCNHW